jgi:hypothetical protein
MAHLGEPAHQLQKLQIGVKTRDIHCSLRVWPRPVSPQRWVVLQSETGIAGSAKTHWDTSSPTSRARVDSL